MRATGHEENFASNFEPTIFQKRKLRLEGKPHTSQGFSQDTVVPEVCMSGPQRGFTH